MGTTQARPLSTTSIPQNVVIAHIYDAQPFWSKINDFLNARTKWGGAFHCGIEVDGVEYSFGPEDGWYWQDPKMYPSSLRESIFLGVTQYGADERVRLLAEEFDDWRSDEYRISSNNCIDFCDSLTVLLGVDRLPRWVGRLPRSFPRLDQMGDTEFSWIRSSASLLDMGEFGNNDEDREPEYLPHLTENTVVMHFENKSWKPKKIAEIELIPERRIRICRRELTEPGEGIWIEYPSTIVQIPICARKSYEIGDWTQYLSDAFGGYIFAQVLDVKGEEIRLDVLNGFIPKYTQQLRVRYAHGHGNVPTEAYTPRLSRELTEDETQHLVDRGRNYEQASGA